MDEKIRARLHMVAVTAAAFAAAHDSRNPAYDWLTLNESESLANLRTQLAELAREERQAVEAAEKRRKKVTA